MALEIGLVGLPNAGKSTLFNALVRGSAQVAAFPFTTVDRNIGYARVPDSRLDRVAEAIGSHSRTPAAVRFVDIAGLVERASRGEGLGNQFLGHIREVDAIAHVVRCFRAPSVAHVAGDLGPARDVDVVSLELILADLETVRKHVEKVLPAARAGDRDARARLESLERLDALLDGGRGVREAAGAGDRAVADDLGLLTAKPVLYVGNVDEEALADPMSDPLYSALADRARGVGSPVVALCARLEEELSELENGERADFIRELGAAAAGIDRLVEAGYRLLDLITVFTANEDEARARAVVRGSTALDVAGMVHSDMKRGFIAAEVIQADELSEAGSLDAARASGRVRLEGRDYVCRDGDVIRFRFNV